MRASEGRVWLRVLLESWAMMLLMGNVTSFVLHRIVRGKLGRELDVIIPDGSPSTTSSKSSRVTAIPRGGDNGGDGEK